MVLEEIKALTALTALKAFMEPIVLEDYNTFYYNRLNPWEPWSPWGSG